MARNRKCFNYLISLLFVIIWCLSDLESYKLKVLPMDFKEEEFTEFNSVVQDLVNGGYNVDPETRDIVRRLDVAKLDGEKLRHVYQIVVAIHNNLRTAWWEYENKNECINLPDEEKRHFALIKLFIYAVSINQVKHSEVVIHGVQESINISSLVMRSRVIIWTNDSSMLPESHQPLIS